MSKNSLASGELSVRPSSSEYEVGYAKPPAETRFKPGLREIPKADLVAAPTSISSQVSGRNG